MPAENLASDVARACRILEAQGHGHSFLGHVSARAPGEIQMLVKPSGIDLGEVYADDLLTVDLEGRKLAGEDSPHAEMPIHTAIYRRRPDVNAVVHTHPLHVAGLVASTSTFEMVNQDSVHFADGIGYYSSPALIVTARQGDALASALGRNRAVLLRNHGMVTVGATVQEAVFLAVALVNSLRVQAMATQFGALAPMTTDEVAEMAADMAGSYHRRVAATWHYLSRLLLAEDA